MLTAGTIYWLSRLGYASFALILMSIIVGLFFFTLLACRLACFIDGDNLPKKFRNAHNAIGIAFAVLLMGSILVPSSKEVAAMYVIPKIANSETVQELGDQVKTLAVEWLEELRPKQIVKED